MDWDQFDLNPKVIAALKKADIKSIKEVLNLSGADLQRLMKLSSADVECLLKTVSRALRKNCMLTALQLYQDKDCLSSQCQKLSLGCSVLDNLLRGGIPLVGITEIAGESSAGKTQIGLQLCLCVQYPYRYGGLESGAVYICTEDAFPSKRLQQLIAQQHKLRADVPPEIIQKIRFGNSIFVEHAADLDTFHKCITKRISVLLTRGVVRLVVIDSIAALFRCEFGASDSILKARYLQTFGAQLHGLSTRFRAPIMCINQVTDAVSEAEAVQCGDSSASRVFPALGITWANQLLMRLMVSRVPQPEPLPGAVSHLPASVRTLRVVFAPHLPPSFCCYTVKLEGVKGMKSVLGAV
ncbi:DNA repair protein XRCC3 isoform X1 [Numida meleagris]|uniref:DNA repair protein XRCC3 isoform X1 n=1 Tax=Numida meleagris TaxID=8996 RepID=UPI000B3E3462|nr:DNA repair protein XRCC3 isoform X1 [Numida meleagris]XP_021257714.1 DNA repair protein XRCC3 isoform X1 [Numida meleagris]XP_021257715.1 DNA repair protein XRCC3 isoform X1 [Numida meleagris]